MRFVSLWASRMDWMLLSVNFSKMAEILTGLRLDLGREVEGKSSSLIP